MIVNSRKVWSNRDIMDDSSGGSNSSNSSRSSSSRKRSNKNVEVLVMCRFLLKFLHLCDKNRVRIKILPSKEIEIPNFIIFGGFAAPMAYELGMLMWACLAEDVIIEKRPSLMCVILSNLQAFLTYTSMVKTNRFTIETIEYIQEVVDKSELLTRLSDWADPFNYIFHSQMFKSIKKCEAGSVFLMASVIKNSKFIRILAAQKWDFYEWSSKELSWQVICFDERHFVNCWFNLNDFWMRNVRLKKFDEHFFKLLRQSPPQAKMKPTT